MKIMNKFTFYCGYWDLFEKLSARQFRKLMLALTDYVEHNFIPEKLPKKTFLIFMKIKLVIDAEKERDKLIEKRRNAGKKGMKNRWG